MSFYGYAFYNITNSLHPVVNNYVSRVRAVGGIVTDTKIDTLSLFCDEIDHILPKLEVAHISGTDTNVGADIPFIEMADYPMIRQSQVSITVDGNGHNLYQTTNNGNGYYYSAKTETKPLSFICFDYNIGAFNKIGLFMGDHSPNSARYGAHITWANRCYVDCNLSKRFFRAVPHNNRFICINSGSNGGTKNDLYFNDTLVFTGDKVVSNGTQPYRLFIMGSSAAYSSHFPHTAKAFIWADLLTDTETVDLYNALINNF